MPTKTKEKTADRTAELQDKLRGLEKQHQHAAAALMEARERAEEIAARQQEIAVAVISGEAAAVRENDQLEEALLLENRRRETARSAAKQLKARLEEANEDLAAEARRIHLERAGQLAGERYALEARAEEDVGRLLATLSELERLDRRHCQEMRLGGAEPPNEPLAWTLEPWLLTRLSGWVRENPNHQGFAAQTLPAADSLAGAPEQDS
jgi:hypothetical protein